MRFASLCRLCSLAKCLAICLVASLSGPAEPRSELEATQNASCLLQMRFHTEEQEERLEHGVGLNSFEEQYISDDWQSQIYGQDDISVHSETTGEVREHQSLVQSVTMRNKTRIIHHHIWKNGGSHFCEMARSAGFRTPLNHGCHRLRDDKDEWDWIHRWLTGNMTVKLWRPCAAYDPGIDKLPFDFLGHECLVNETIISMAEREGFAWVEILRDPIEQAASWFSHANHNTNGKFGSIHQWTTMCNASNHCGFYTFVPNLQTRWLAGDSCEAQIEDSEVLCLDKAMTNLRRMAVILEQSGNTLLGTEKLEKLGWTVPQTNSTSFISRAAQYIANMSGEERAWLSELQRLDITLIERARAENLI